MLDRFKDAKWYIGGDPLSATIYDASDLEGYGVVCQGAVIEDARLIASAPELLQALQLVLDILDHKEGRIGGIRAVVQAAIAKATGWLVCQDGQHRCFNTGQPCGCRCDDCRDDTEPRCDVCNGLINKYGSAIGHCENESDHEGNGGYARLLDTDPKFESFVRGYIDKAEGRA